MLEWITDPAAWAALVTLTAMEIVLGIDNVVFIAVLVSRLPASQRERARRIGLSLALVFRIGLLTILAWLIGLTEPVFTILGQGVSWRDIILASGGLFLIYKAVHEIHGEIEQNGNDEEAGSSLAGASFFYIYFAMAFAAGVEMINVWAHNKRRRRADVQDNGLPDRTT